MWCVLGKKDFSVVDLVSRGHQTSCQQLIRMRTVPTTCVHLYIYNSGVTLYLLGSFDRKDSKSSCSTSTSLRLSIKTHFEAMKLTECGRQQDGKFWRNTEPGRSISRREKYAGREGVADLFLAKPSSSNSYHISCYSNFNNTNVKGLLSLSLHATCFFPSPIEG